MNYKEANVECASSDDDNEISEKEIYSTSRKIGISEHKIVDLENKFESDLTVALSRESSSDSRNSSPTFSSFKGNTFASPAQSVPASSNILEPGGSAVGKLKSLIYKKKKKTIYFPNNLYLKVISFSFSYKNKPQLLHIPLQVLIQLQQFQVIFISIGQNYSLSNKNVRFFRFERIVSISIHINW